MRRPAPADRVEVDHLPEVGDVGLNVVAPVHRVGALRVVVRDAQDPLEPSAEQPVGLALDPARHVGVGRAPVRGVVLEAAVGRRVVRRGDHDPVRPTAPAAVVLEDRVRDDRRRGGAVAGVDADVDAVGGQHLDDRLRGRLRQRVRVAAEEQRPVDPLCLAVAADRLADGQHVRLGERARERGAAVAGRPERHAVRRVRLLVVGLQQPADVDQVRLLRKRARARIDAHLPPISPGTVTGGRLSQPGRSCSPLPENVLSNQGTVAQANFHVMRFRFLTFSCTVARCPSALESKRRPHQAKRFADRR